MREAAIEALQKLPADATVEKLAFALRRGENFLKRQGAATALSRQTGDGVGPALQAGLRDSNSSVRAEVVLALSMIDTQAAMESVLSATRDQDAEVRVAAATSLGRFDDPR